MNDFATNLAFAIAMLVAPPDLHLTWNAPTEATPPDHYEVQAATNLLQFSQPVRGVFQFTGQSVYTTDASLPIYLDAPQRFYRVRTWKDIQCSDWGTAITDNTN